MTNNSSIDNSSIDNSSEENISMPHVLVICGPTASGKSAVAILVAQKIHGEIISADSMQIYRGLNIGTAKVTLEEQALVPHHIIDCCDPDELFSVAQFKSNALRIISEIIARGNLPIVCGGTGLYISSLIDGVDFVETKTDYALRESLHQRANLAGLSTLYAELAAVDPTAASRINPNDQKRIVRALEIYLTTGVTQTDHEAISRLKGPEYDFKVFILSHDRDILYQRINQRVDAMFASGLIEEAKMFYAKYPTASTSNQAIGYKEVLRYLHGEETLAQALALIKQSTRRYAKRQLTWFRKIHKAKWINNQTIEAATLEILTEFNG